MFNVNFEKPLHHSKLSVRGVSVDTFVLGMNEFFFGSPEQRNVTHLEHFVQVNGFMNAFGDVMDGAYKVIEAGFHSKISWDELISAWEDRKDVAMVNFDMLILTNNVDTLAKLARMGIKDQPNELGWLSLDVRHGRFHKGEYLRPKTETELRNGHEAKDVHPDERAYNEKLWNQVHKHNGVHLVQMTLEGRMSVYCCHPSRAGFEWQDRVSEQKYRGLYGSAETRLEKRAEVIAKVRSQLGNNRAAYETRFNTNRQAELQEATAGGVEILDVNGEPVIVQATDLVKKRVVYILPDKTERRGGVYLTALENVQNAVVYARTNGYRLQIKAIQ